MAEALQPIRSRLLREVPHGFLDADQSDSSRFDLVPHAQGPVFLKQVHSADVLNVSAPFAGDPSEADGMVTATPGLALAIRTADCAPVLFWDQQARVIGAAHAGWRGAYLGVLEATVDAMEGLGALRSRIRAAIGPVIRQQSYEVDDGFRQRLLQDSSANVDLFQEGRPGHFQFDLPAYVERRLVHRAGLLAVEDIERDTYSEPENFHSYRRATHLGEPTTGRLISLIALPQ